MGFEVFSHAANLNKFLHAQRNFFTFLIINIVLKITNVILIFESVIIGDKMSSKSDEVNMDVVQVTSVVSDDQEVEATTINITEESLVSQETLERSSPEIWGDNSVQKFVAKFHPSPSSESPTWLDITPDDKKEIARLESLNEDELMMMAKGLFDRAYFLEKEELVEMQKGKLLNIYNNGQDVRKNNLPS